MVSGERCKVRPDIKSAEASVNIRITVLKASACKETTP